ncbi:hypothetical protein [Streptomyces sp. NPDC050738]|uniref:hypothetical protein n=1 Tax=Streptomyces sp. NPDC050738 TaxID=3154744 RepID=UPI003423301C
MSLLVAIAAGALIGCSHDPTPAERAQGDLLDGGIQSDSLVGVDDAVIGEDFWVALPVPSNKSSQPLEVTGAKFLNVPQGAKLVGYGAYTLEETDGLALLTRRGDSGMPDFDKLKNHLDEVIQVPGKSASETYYVAHVKITGPMNANFHGCKFDYQQGSRKYTQTVNCEASLRLAK